MMDVLIVGFGSIGKRHAKNFSKYANIFIFDINLKKLETSFNYTFIDNLNYLLSLKFDLAVIATPTSIHIKNLLMFKKISKFFFIEKPLSVNLRELKEINNSLKKKIIVACNMRYHKGVNKIMENISLCGKVFFVKNYFRHSILNMNRNKSNYIFDEKNEYSILFDCIHELDYLNFYFGIKKIKKIFNINLTKNLINTDFMEITLNLKKNILAQTFLNFIDQHKFRGLEVIGEKGTLIWKSEGKFKENINVSFYSNNDQKKNLLKIDDYNDNEPYELMTKDLVSYIKGGLKKNKCKLSFYKDSELLLKNILNF